MTVYLSVCTAAVQPFQCDGHPNGQRTMRAYPQVVCDNGTYGREHEVMVVLGSLSGLVPLGFLSLAVWATLSLPKRLNKGDTTFLHTFAFLFFRFRPQAHWYLLVLLFRNLALALVPVLANDSTELFSFSVVVLCCVLVGVSTLPWAVHEANHVDVALHTGLLGITFLAALQTRSVDEVLTGRLLVAVFTIMMSVFLGAVLWCVRLLWVRRRKPFQFFLCHHKEGGGAFCRLLKLRLKTHSSLNRKVFLDSDNLQDLTSLFGIVANDTETLVVLCSREILYRPWCVGEMTTARIVGVDTMLVMFPNFQHPTQDLIANYVFYVEGVSSLAPFGISTSMVTETLWWLGTRPWVVLPHQIGVASADAVAQKLISRNRRLDYALPHARSRIVATVHDTDCLATGTPRCTLRARTQPPPRHPLRCGVHRGPLQPGDGVHGSHHQGTLEEPFPFVTGWVRVGRCTRSSAEHTDGVGSELQRLLPEY